MRNFCAALLVLAPLISAPTLAGDTAYDFKGIRLGISVDEFRRTAFPDRPPANFPYGASKVHVACTGDRTDWPYTVVEVYDDEKAIGLIKCAFFGTGSLGGTLSHKSQLGFQMGGGRGASYSYDFLFVRDSNGVPRLFKIVLPTNIAALTDIVEALTEKFGPATEKSNRSVQNKMGATFPQRTYTWSNGTSSIFVQGPRGELDKMVVAYTHNSLSARVDTLVKGQKAKIKNRM